MYRQYEDPYKLEKELERVQEEYQRFLDDGGVDEDGYWYERIADLKDRINFAWQDNEYEENYMRENYGDEEWMEENVYSATDVEDHCYYRISIGTGTAYVDSFVIETEQPTRDYDALTDILIDYLADYYGDSRIIDWNKYEWDDAYETIHPIDDPDLVIYPDEFVQGGNAGDVLRHYGEFRINEIAEDQIKDYDIIVPDVWQID